MCIFQNLVQYVYISPAILYKVCMVILYKMRYTIRVVRKCAHLIQYLSIMFCTKGKI
nr:MAG TPA: hypothetical protein [Inoviridae sp.]